MNAQGNNMTETDMTITRQRGEKMAGVAGLEPVTSAVTGQRSNQLSYTPAKGDVTLEKVPLHVKVCLGSFFKKLSVVKSGQQTPRRWGWGTPLKKRTATRMPNVTTWKRFVNKLVVLRIF